MLGVFISIIMTPPYFLAKKAELFKISSKSGGVSFFKSFSVEIKDLYELLYLEGHLPLLSMISLVVILLQKSRSLSALE